MMFKYCAQKIHIINTSNAQNLKYIEQINTQTSKLHSFILVSIFFLLLFIFKFLRRNFGFDNIKEASLYTYLVNGKLIIFNSKLLGKDICIFLTSITRTLDVLNLWII